jgi:hypothetical protein
MPTGPRALPSGQDKLAHKICQDKLGSGLPTKKPLFLCVFLFDRCSVASFVCVCVYLSLSLSSLLLLLFGTLSLDSIVFSQELQADDDT